MASASKKVAANGSAWGQKAQPKPTSAADFFITKSQFYAAAKKRFGEPSKEALARHLRQLVVQIRTTLGWETVDVSLANPSAAVREVERTFRTVNWNFQRNMPAVKERGPPPIDLVVQSMVDLARYFRKSSANQQVAEARAIAHAAEVKKQKHEEARALRSAEDARAMRQKARERKKEVVVPPFIVRGCKSGTFPVAVEKRKHGKLVTIVRNVSGDVPQLLQELKHTLGAGGVYDGASQRLEVQGDHVKRISKFLVQRGCLKGVRKKIKEATQDKDEQRRKLAAKTNMRPVKKRIEIDTSVRLSPKEVNRMNPKTLKLHLSAHGMSTQGNKKELHKRLMSIVR